VPEGVLSKEFCPRTGIISKESVATNKDSSWREGAGGVRERGTVLKPKCSAYAVQTETNPHKWKFHGRREEEEDTRPRVMVPVPRPKNETNVRAAQIGVEGREYSVQHPSRNHVQNRVVARPGFVMYHAQRPSTNSPLIGLRPAKAQSAEIVTSKASAGGR